MRKILPSYYSLRITYEEYAKPDNLMIASFNCRLLRHIMACWDTDIKNLDDVKGWTPYVRLYNFLMLRLIANKNNDYTYKDLFLPFCLVGGNLVFIVMHIVLV